MNACMVDLETWGTRPGSVIRSIGAVQFNPFDHPGKLGATFYHNVAEQDQLDLQLMKDPGTIEFWNKPENAGAAELLEKDQKPIGFVMMDFLKWYSSLRFETVWSQGANFDVVLIDEINVRLRIVTPWKFWAVRDTRTVYDLAKIDFRRIPNPGVKHHALDDAKLQAGVIQMGYKKLLGY